tara:strand:+ start:2599 stop:3597 length:999 start_codon:yes stop_codon:yes gene_type:complete
MAIYKTTSSQTVIRKVYRDLRPDSDHWIDDAVEWIGEALEHIGAAASLERKGCTLEVNNHKAVLPADLYYINQVAINETPAGVGSEAQILDLRNQVKLLNDNLKTYNNNLADTVISNEDGTFQSSLTTDDLKNFQNLKKTTDHEIREINARLAVLETSYLDPAALTSLAYCTTNFPEGLHCDSCVNKRAKSKECYYIDTGYIKTSFASGTVCLNYMAIPTDADCYPMVPDDISFKEAMFWYIVKKMILGGFAPKSGVNYQLSEQQWKYYCSQARNAAVFPDIDRWESFMNQWVRLIPNLNRHAVGFDNLGSRESLDRGHFNTSKLTRVSDVG